ncbi:MAG: hypothetical protein HY962_01525 [Ignavibacteriae bacterium]|nr:hypothetical protein [Ignavibacteriota bacterium]
MRSGLVVKLMCVLLTTLGMSVRAGLPENQAMNHTNASMNVTEARLGSTRLPVFTLECWIRDSARVVLAARDLPAANGTDWSLVYNWSNQCLEFMTQENGGPDIYIYSPANSLTPFTWQHIAIVVNGPAGRIKGYINGAEVMSASFPARSFDANVALSWGGYSGGGGAGRGRIDECRYWSIERTQQQIVNAKDSSLRYSDRNGLVGYWPFCGDFTDQSGNGNHGIPRGATLVPAPELTGIGCCMTGIVPPPTIGVIGSRSLCVGDSAVLDAGGGYAAYRWSTGDTTRRITVRRAGVYQVVVYDTSGCTGADTVAIYELLQLVPRINGPEVFCAQQTVCLETDTVYASYRWSTGDTTRRICVTQEGRYTVDVTNGNGCAGTAVFYLRRHTNQLTISGNLTLCLGDSTLLVAKAGYASYRWSTGDTTMGIVRRTTGMVSVFARTSYGCVDTASAYIVRAGTGARITSSSLVLCASDSVTLTAHPAPASYRWSTGESTRAITVHAPGSYSVIVDDGSGCRDSVAVLVTRNTKSGPRLGGSYILCDRGVFGLDAGSGYAHYLWSTGDTTRAILVNRTGRYSLRVIDSNGCVYVDSCTVVAGQAPTPVISGRSVFCAGDSTILDVGAGYVSCVWSTGDTGRSLRVTKSGLYSVTVRNANGCEGTVSVLVKVGGANASIQGRVYLCNDTTQLTVYPAFTSYRWSTGDTSRVLRVHRPGLYSVLVTDSLGCSATVQTLVQDLPRLVPTVQGSGYLCAGDSADLRVREDADTYLWSTGDTTRAIRIGAPGTYTVRVSKTGYCDGFSTIVVRFAEKPVPSISGRKRVCSGDTTTYVTVSAGGITRQWRVVGGVVLGPAADDSVIVHWNSPGDRRLVLLEVNDTTGCRDSLEFGVTVIAAPSPRISPTGDVTLCEGDSLLLDAGSGLAGYMWSDGRTSSRIVVRESGVYSVTVTDSSGCTGTSESVRVRVTAAPHIHIQGPGSVCRNSRVQYVVQTGDSVEVTWIATGGTIAGPTDSSAVTVVHPTVGVYRIIAIARKQGCSFSDTLDVVVADEARAVITAVPSTRFCAGETVLLDAGAGYAVYEWHDGTGRVLGSARTLSTRNAGRIFLRVVSPDSCRASADVELTMYPAPVVQIGGTPGFCIGDSTKLDGGQEFVSWRWSDGSTGRFLTVKSPGLYSVTVTDSNGCTGTGAVIVVRYAIPSGGQIIIRGDTLFAPAAASYQWYYRGQVIPGATSRIQRAVGEGVHEVYFKDGNGCTSVRSADWTAGDILVEIPALEAAPGERIDIPVFLRTTQQLSSFGVTGYIAEIRFDAGLLRPVDGRSVHAVHGTQRYVSLLQNNSIFAIPLAVIPCTAMLGSIDTTALIIEKFDFTGRDLRVRRSHGTFRLKICREGGARLFEGDSATVRIVRVAPNPFNASTSIEYEVIERGATKLSVIDLLGRRVATLVDGPVEPGRHRVVFDASALASGSYALVLETPAHRRIRLIQLDK